MITNRKQIFTLLSGFAVALIIFYIIGYALAVSSKPFSYVKKELSASNLITEKIGKVQKFDLAFFGYAIRKDGPKEKAEFELTAVGVKGKTLINIRLETDLGVWQIVGLRVNGESIPIENN